MSFIGFRGQYVDQRYPLEIPSLVLSLVCLSTELVVVVVVVVVVDLLMPSTRKVSS